MFHDACYFEKNWNYYDTLVDTKLCSMSSKPNTKCVILLLLVLFSPAWPIDMFSFYVSCLSRISDFYVMFLDCIVLKFCWFLRCWPANPVWLCPEHCWGTSFSNPCTWPSVCKIL